MQRISGFPTHSIEWKGLYIELSINGGKILFDPDNTPATKKHPKFVFENIDSIFSARMTPLMLQKLIVAYSNIYFEDINGEVILEMNMEIQKEYDRWDSECDCEHEYAYNY